MADREPEPTACPPRQVLTVYPYSDELNRDEKRIFQAAKGDDVYALATALAEYEYNIGSVGVDALERAMGAGAWRTTEWLLDHTGVDIESCGYDLFESAVRGGTPARLLLKLVGRLNILRKRTNTRMTYAHFMAQRAVEDAPGLRVTLVHTFVDLGGGPALFVRDKNGLLPSDCPGCPPDMLEAFRAGRKRTVHAWREALLEHTIPVLADIVVGYVNGC